jgi:hypothetical protein
VYIYVIYIHIYICSHGNKPFTLICIEYLMYKILYIAFEGTTKINHSVLFSKKTSRKMAKNNLFWLVL